MDAGVLGVDEMSKIKDLLVAASADERATAELFTLVYDELRLLAASHLSHESPGNTLQPTALVHEAYLRLLGSSRDDLDGPKWECRAHFFGAAAEAMRRILIEAARRKKREKHGGGLVRQSLDPERVAEPEVADELLALNEALTKLAETEPEVARLVNLRYFGGLTLEEAAAAMGFTSRTASSYWAYARVWIQAEIRRGEDP